jgi:lipopolysaccharide transport system permease protein
MFGHIRELMNARELLWAWTARTVRARYEQSVLGWLWAVILPASQAAVFTVIFTVFVPVKTGKAPYMLFCYAAMVPWTFFSVALTDMSSSLVGNMPLVTKIYFPRETLPISAMLARLLDALAATAVLAAMLIYARVDVRPLGLLYLVPVVGAELLLLIGLGLAAAAANVFYRDVQSILTLVVQLWFYLSPVVYPATSVPARLRPFYFLNPMAGILESFRDVLLFGRAPGPYLALSLAMGGVLFVFGYWSFKRVEFLFADLV